MEDINKMYYDQLVKEYYEGTISVGDIEILRDAVNKGLVSDPELSVLKEILAMESEIVSALEMSMPVGLEDAIMDRVHHRKKIVAGVNRRRLAWLSVAASVACLICAGIFFIIGGEDYDYVTGMLAHSQDTNLRVNKIAENVQVIGKESGHAERNSLNGHSDTGRVRSGRQRAENLERTVSEADNSTGNVADERIVTEEELTKKREELQDCLALFCDVFSDAFNEYKETVEEVSTTDVIMKL